MSELGHSRRFSHVGEMSASIGQLGSSTFQAIHHFSVDVSRRLSLLFGIGTKALPSWGSKTRRNNLYLTAVLPSE